MGDPTEEANPTLARLAELMKWSNKHERILRTRTHSQHQNEQDLEDERDLGTNPTEREGQLRQTKPWRYGRAAVERCG